MVGAERWTPNLKGQAFLLHQVRRFIGKTIKLFSQLNLEPAWSPDMFFSDPPSFDHIITLVGQFECDFNAGV